MLKVPEDVRVYVCTEPTDMKKAINGLSVLVADYYSGHILSGDMYLFFNKNKDIVKVLYWHQNGFVLHHKRLEKQKFVLPKNKSLDMPIEINEVQLQGLLAGLDFMLMQKFPEIDYTQLF